MQGTTGKAIRTAALTLVAVGALAIGASSAAAEPPVISGTTVSSVTTTSATLEATVNPEGEATEYHFEYGTVDCTPEPSLCTSVPVPDRNVEEGEEGPLIERAKEHVTGLSPSTIYHVRLVARNGTGMTEGPDHVFATYSTPLLGLPGGRAYEQASPVDKDGNDAVGSVAVVKAASTGGGISFGSTFGIPGGKGAQTLTSYLAKRGPGQSGWATQGLLPPATFGPRAQVVGWTADYSEVFSNVAHLGEPITTAFLGQPTDGSEPTLIAPYTEDAEYFYAGESADGSTVFFEARVQLPVKEGAVPAKKGFSNLYAWDRASGKISLAGVLNDKEAPPKGAFAGPYNWAIGTNARGLREGGASANYYLQAEHAISTGGDIYFTEAGSGQLYLRRNPTEKQSLLDGEGKCTEEDKACTIQVSASEKTDGISEDAKDPVGPQPAAFQAASADGSEVFFTSPEKLTNEANTGPEQPEAAIGLGAIGGGIEDEKLIPEAAVGVAVDSKSEYIYWANPALGSIGRAKLNGAGKPTEVNPGFLVPGPVEFKEETSPGVFKTESVESEPRYVAVDAGHIYWTNTGRREELGDPMDGGGTIGRAKLNGAAAPSEIKADFILGASNPQGIAVNASHIYWANAARELGDRAVAQAGIEGDSVNQVFHLVNFNGESPLGVALSATHVYVSVNEDSSNNSYMARFPLEGGANSSFRFIGVSILRGIAVDGGHVYWAAQGEKAIGRADLELTAASVEKEFTKEIKGALNGLAADAAHLYWSVNGESATNPGNDLYRYRPAANPGEKGTLEDLTVVAGGNGAEVQGVVGASEDGSYLYFVANGVLDDGEEAAPGDCHTSTLHGSLPSTSGSCNLYAWHEGAVSLVARLEMKRGYVESDMVNWMPTPREVFSGGTNAPKTSFLSKDGRTLLFRSQEKLSAYDNEGVPEFYRYRAGEPALRCASCRPSGEAAGLGPSLGSISFPSLGPLSAVASVSSRNFSADGNHAFFESAEALSAADTNGAGGCLPSGSGSQAFPACEDVYEWVASGTDSCQPGSPSYSPLNAGCLYLISTGKDKFPSLFADASESGEDVFFFTRQSLVGQDKDELQDVYDARAGGGLASQNQLAPVPCESPEACHESPPPVPAEASPGSAGFLGPANPKHKKQKPKKHKHKKHPKHPHAKKHKKANANRGAGR
jgi:hypothetical protein